MGVGRGGAGRAVVTGTAGMGARVVRTSSLSSSPRAGNCSNDLTWISYASFGLNSYLRVHLKYFFSVRIISIIP